jgi:hypothetical protein
VSPLYPRFFTPGRMSARGERPGAFSSATMLGGIGRHPQAFA